MPSNLKGHKRYCAFQNCLCNKCELVIERRYIIKSIIAHKRLCELEESRIESTHDICTSSGYNKDL